MKITFFGAAREITGSCYLVEAGRTRLLVDCGMFQGSAFSEARNFNDFGFDPQTIDAVIITHAHIDHVGRLPKLIKEKFAGKIYLTLPTAKITDIVLRDAEHIMEEALKREYRPKLYDLEDVENVIKSFKTLDYNRRVNLDGVSFRLRDAGHIFGSAFVELEEDGGSRAIFSGDVGNINVPILRPTAQMAECDALLIESTYGNRLHEDESTRGTRLKQAIQNTIKQKGVLLIPAFAIERTQQLLYELNHLIENGLIPKVDIYLDSPMAIAVTKVIKAYPKYYDKEAFRLVCKGDDLFDFHGLHQTASRDDSKKINTAPFPKIIIAGAGMMNGGRIQHHLIRYLSSKKTTVLIVGYQAHGTLGRRLYSGDKKVRIFNESIQVKAKVLPIGAYSAHADQQKLLDWIGNARSRTKHVYCVHGEEDSAAALATRIKQEFGIQADVPRYGDTVNI
ncbi:MBL fold metallo-hydrolase [Patescibacteria group bacterium]|nr:MBL fold metallo-hydrolase [Patescibacteria group bacterium]MBU1907759.1 MBL fold metallo-hydrolase [Patescibacteria group bacterium]